MDLLNKGKEFLGSEKGKELTEDAKEGYSAYSKAEGSQADKAKAGYSAFSAAQKDDGKSEKKEKK